MPSALFRFRESWWVAADVARVAGVLADPEHFPAWWPQVLAVAAAGPGRARVLCRSRLPYTLDLLLTEVSGTPPTLLVEMSGDLAGWARFGLAPEAGGTRVAYAQEVAVHGWRALAAGALRRPMEANHRAMMRGCREGQAARLSR